MNADQGGMAMGEGPQNPEETVKAALPQLPQLLLPYQKGAISNPARFTWNCWSRQTGKSFTGALRRILRGMDRRKNQIFLSAGERQSRELMMKAQQHIRVMQLAFDYREDQFFEGTEFKQLEIGLPAFGIRIIGLPANPNTSRGFTGDVLLDEFALHGHDREIWAAMFPTLLRGAGELDVWSTPKGRSNLFYSLRVNPEFDCNTLTIDNAIADGLKVDREKLRRAMGDDQLWRQEFLCEFVDELAAFLTFEMIQECEDQKLPRELDLEALKEHKGDVVVGVDVGRVRDLTVIWAFDVVGSQLISRGLLELAATPFRTQFETLSTVLGNRCIRRCCIDSTGLGMQLAEELVERFGAHLVEACTFTAPFKSEIAGGLRVKVEDKNIHIPVCPEIRNDLHSVRKSVTTAGNVRLEAPREDGSHADRFYAAALAVHAASDFGGPPEAMFGPDLPFTRPGVAW